MSTEKVSFNVPGAEGNYTQVLNCLKLKLARLQAAGYGKFSLEIRGVAQKGSKVTARAPAPAGKGGAPRRRKRP